MDDLDMFMEKMNNLLHDLNDEGEELSLALSEINSDNNKEAKH
jgi:hypothetical protein